MKISNSMTFLLVALVFVVAPLQSANAFVVPVDTNVKTMTTTTTTTALDVSTIYSDFEHAYDGIKNNKIKNNNDDDDALTKDLKFPTPVATTNNNKAVSSHLEIPRHVRPTPTEVENAKVLMSLEAILGRGAMLAAIVLMTTEMTTGMSLPEQLSKLL